MTVVDPYKTLGVDRKASEDEIKKAYRNLAKKFHPDKNKSTDAEDRFKEIGAAYDLLKDVDKRRVYDMQRAGDEEKAANARSKFHQSSHRSTSTPRSGSARRARFGQKAGPRTSFTFTFATFDDDDDDEDEDFEKFFHASFNDERKTNAGGRSRNKNNKPWRERAKAASGGGTNQSFGERPEWDKNWGDPFQTNSFLSDFDSIFGKQVSDMNHLLGDLLGESPLFKFRGSNGILDEDFFFDALGGRARGPRMRPRRSTLADMWDWSVPMFRQKKNDPFASFEGSEDDMADIRFPCIYCGKELSSSNLNAHEAICKRFYGDKGNVDSDSFRYSPSAKKNVSSKDATNDNKKHSRGNSANSAQARFRDNKENQSRRKPPGEDDFNQQEENGHVICPWCEKEFHRSIALRHITACELLSPSSSRAGHVPPSTRQQNTSKPAGRNYQSRQADESSPKKTSEQSFEDAEDSRSRVPRQSSRANSKRTNNASSASGHPSGRKFMDEPFIMSGSGLHTPRASRTEARSRPSRSTAHDIGDGLRGKTVHFTKV